MVAAAIGPGPDGYPPPRAWGRGAPKPRTVVRLGVVVNRKWYWSHTIPVRTVGSPFGAESTGLGSVGDPICTTKPVRSGHGSSPVPGGTRETPSGAARTTNRRFGTSEAGNHGVSGN